MTLLVWPESYRVKQGVLALNNILYGLYLLMAGFVQYSVSYSLSPSECRHSYPLTCIFSSLFNYETGI